MKIFLTLKHWQLFLLLMGIPIIFEFIEMGAVFSGNRPGKMFFLFPVIMILCTGLFFSWFYALGTNLYKKLPGTVKMNLILFRLFLFTPVVYILLISVFMIGILSTGGRPHPAIIILIILLHLFSMFCIFYCLYFNAKALKATELQRPVIFSDFAGEFFLLCFLPVGIWIIQPRINRLFDKSTVYNI